MSTNTTQSNQQADSLVEKKYIDAFVTKADFEDFVAKNKISHEAFATKADLEAFATKADLEAFATKADLEAFATKADLEAFATKADINASIKTIIDGLAEDKKDRVNDKKLLLDFIAEVNTRMNAFENTLDETRPSIGRSKLALGNDDVTRATDSLARIWGRIKRECDTKTVDDVSVAVAAALFCTLVETGMTTVVSMTQGRRPSLYTKKGWTDTPSSGFNWPHGCRANDEQPYILINGYVNETLNKLLADAGRAWTPYRATNRSGIVYTATSYFFAVVRHIRNVGTHRSLDSACTETIEVDNTDVLTDLAASAVSDAFAASGPASLLQRVTHMWIPYNPSASEYIDKQTQHGTQPDFQDGKPHEHKDNGFVKVSTDLFMKGLRAAADDAHSRIRVMMTTFLVARTAGTSV